jgi:hypothetical protein
MQEGRKRRVERLGETLKGLSEDELTVLSRAAAIIETVSRRM